MTPEQRVTLNTPRNSRAAVETALERLHQERTSGSSAAVDCLVLRMRALT